ncbi:phage tail protein [Escherichia coli]|nr:phage tail protein [Escherichia coli]
MFDEHGDLIAVGNTAESYKPAVAEQGPVVHKHFAPF